MSRLVAAFHDGAPLRTVLATLPIAALLLCAPATVRADDGPAGADDETYAESTQRARQPERNFLFGDPRGSIGIRGGLNFARADSDIFEFNDDLLTLEKSDYRAGTFAVDVGWFLNPRVQAVFGVEYSRTSPVSEFRDFVDSFGAPIVQETRLEQAPLTASLKLFLIPRGKRVSQYAWVPNAVSPYVGGGLGGIWYRYQQFGDFVDFADLTIFNDHFISEGWSGAAQAFGGAEVGLTPRLTLALEARYVWADAELGAAFVGFEPIDLSGLRTTAGINFYF